MARTTALSSEELEQIDSVWKAPGLKPTLVAVFCAFGGWALLLPVIPLAIIDNGGSDGLAGLSTGVFMGATVLTQEADGVDVCDLVAFVLDEFCSAGRVVHVGRDRVAGGQAHAHER